MFEETKSEKRNPRNRTLNAREYNELRNCIETLEEKLENNKKSFAAKLADFMEELPNKMQEAAKIAENFDPEQFKNVINFATAANGGRPIDFSKENL